MPRKVGQCFWEECWDPNAHYEQYPCLMVIDRNVYYYVYILFQYRNAPSHSGGKSVCACVCLSVCMCVDIMCVCVFVIQGGGRLLPIHLSVRRSATMIFFIYFFKIKCCWYLKSKKSWFCTPIRNLLNCYSLFVRKSSLNSLLIVCSC